MVTELYFPHFKQRFLYIFCSAQISMLSFQVDVQGSAQVNPRIKRASYGQQSSKLLVKHLALELAEKQVSPAKIIFL